MVQKMIVFVSVVGMLHGASAAMVDQLVLGDAASEAEHGLAAEHSEIIKGALNTPARHFLPRDDHRWRGGTATFEMMVDPKQKNYCTVKLWGGDASQNYDRMMLFIDGKQVGQRHLGENDQLDIGGQHPRFAGRFFYKTIPIPRHSTQGKTTVKLAIESQGGIWAYGPTFERFQRDLKEPSRGIYRMYIHTKSFFEPPADDPQGSIQTPPLREDYNEEVLEKLKERLNGELVDLMKKKDDHYSPEQLAFMARAFHEPWTQAYHSKKILERIVGGIDYQYLRYIGDVPEKEQYNWQGEWVGFGYVGDAVRLLEKELKPYLNDRITDRKTRRKKGWTNMFVDCRDEHVLHRRSYTNQSMIWDMYGIYLCNRGAAAIDRFKAWPETEALQFMYESMGLEPWSGSRKSKGGSPSYSMGKDHMLLTEAGLTRELGYVGAYGEVLDLVSRMYDATRPAYGKPGDARLRKQVAHIARARAAFRYPSADKDGYRAMRMESVIGWRDFKYPGYVAYDQAISRESIPFEAAAATLDPVLIGSAQQMLEEKQYFAQVNGVMENRAILTSLALINVPHTYETILAQPDQPTRLPMAEGQPNYVFSDPEDGVLAVKNGDEILYISLYWRARYAINNLAKIHHMTPLIEREATVWQETQFNDSGEVHRVRDQVNAPFYSKFEQGYKDGGLGDSLADAGTEQPVAQVSSKFKDYKPGKENIEAGKGTFYLLEYGNYLIAMNCTKDQSFDIEIPVAFLGATDLVSGAAAKGGNCTVKPWQTMVFFRP